MTAWNVKGYYWEHYKSNSFIDAAILSMVPRKKSGIDTLIAPGTVATKMAQYKTKPKYYSPFLSFL